MAVPLIFLSVAAFVLNVALTRAVSLQRPQIATLKAVGYHNGAIARHYLAWALIIACAGILLGVAAGAWLGGLIVELYNEYFRFPVLDFGLSPGVTLLSSGASLLAVALGAWGAVMRAARIPPAEAMRPAAPIRYRHSLIESQVFRPLLSTTSRMVLRNLERQPVRTLTSVLGISAAVAVLVTISMNVIFAGIIAFGVVYNAARISLAERSRELASMRVLGFTRGEISMVLLGELAVLTVASLPIGVLLGDGMCRAISAAFSSEVFRFPMPFSPRMAAWAALTTIAASTLSGLVVRRQLDHLDLVGVLKEGA